jgi:nucleotide-binding universal stress UspA family protein
VTLINVVEWLAEEDPMVSAHFNVPEVRGHMRDDAEQRLHALVAAESRTWCEIDNVVGFGRAHREILRTADMKLADLIVMGAQGRGGVGLALSGSTNAAGSAECRMSCFDRSRDFAVITLGSAPADVLLCRPSPKSR